jgi:hypothetical protein
LFIKQLVTEEGQHTADTRQLFDSPALFDAIDSRAQGQS